MSGILWRHENGAKWRALPAELGPRWMARPDFHPLGSAGCLGAIAEPVAGAQHPTRDDLPRWYQRAGSPESRLACRKEDPKLNETIVRRLVVLVGYGTKDCVIADSEGRAIVSRIAPGQAHELPDAIPLLNSLPGVPPGLWRIRAIPVTASASTSGAWGPDRPSQPRLMRHPSPVRTGSTTTVTLSSVSGRD